MADRVEVTGVSDNGSLQDALDAAIGMAKETLRTDLVNWRLVKVAGEDGGFVLKRSVRVTIEAKAGPGEQADGA